MNKSAISILRAKVRGFQAEGVTLQRMVSRSKGSRRHELRQRKSALGWHSRYHLLTYGFFRGLTYREMEPNCSSKPSATILLDLLKAHSSRDYVTNKSHGPSIPWSLETVEKWLSAVKTEEVANEIA